VYSDWEDVASSGRAFQVFGPATGKTGVKWPEGWAPIGSRVCEGMSPSPEKFFTIFKKQIQGFTHFYCEKFRIQKLGPGSLIDATRWGGD